MSPNEQIQCWQDLREDLLAYFDRISDLLVDQDGPTASHRRLVFRMSERTLIKIIDAMIDESYRAYALELKRGRHAF